VIPDSKALRGAVGTVLMGTSAFALSVVVCLASMLAAANSEPLALLGIPAIDLACGLLVFRTRPGPRPVSPRATRTLAFGAGIPAWFFSVPLLFVALFALRGT
jgi:hypothetical protein